MTSFGSQPASSTAQVLVVDDNRDFAQSLALLLHLAGYRTTCAFDGDGALMLALEHRPLVVVTDLAMPGRDGYRLLAALRAEPACRDAFVVAVSGWGGNAAERQARAAGFDAWFVKPCEHADLMKTVARAVYRGNSLREAARLAGAGTGGTG